MDADDTLPAAADLAEGEVVDVLGDNAYATGQALDKITKAGRRPLVKPGPLTPAIMGGFTLDDFTVDGTAGTAICPNGLTRRITAKRSVTFGAGCNGCPFRAQCTTSKDGRTLHLHKHQALLREHRQRAKDPAWQADYRQHRPMVERSIAWLVAGGNRKVGPPRLTDITDRPDRPIAAPGKVALPGRQTTEGTLQRPKPRERPTKKPCSAES